MSVQDAERARRQWAVAAPANLATALHLLSKDEFMTISSSRLRKEGGHRRNTDSIEESKEEMFF
jgi:hypothetical protein